ncbi:MAG: efflux RND transporter periplasmic adaptor subunit [Spirochaetaceae bacterium]|nr:efflux RND transporter periplasmic adaptor subunit [Spirochaetaceae bacterium]
MKTKEKKIFKKTVAAFTVFISLMLPLAGCSAKDQAQGPGASGGPGGPAQPSQPVFAVSTITVETGKMTDYLMLSGDMIAGSSVDVYSDTAGTITRRYVSIGAVVQKGQPIAEVDPSQPGMQYMASVVTAPISGIVSTLSGQVGMKIGLNSSIAVISGGGGLEIQLYVAERFIYQIRMGLPCEITLDAYPDDSFRGRISEISPVVDTSSRTMMIKVNVDNPGNKLKAGMFANVNIITEEKENVISVPENTILQLSNQQFVYTVVDDTTDSSAKIAKKIVVTTGLNVDGETEITNGLQAGDQIVARGQTSLTDGSRVNVIQ